MIRWATFDRRQTTTKVRRSTIDCRRSVAENRVAAVGRLLSNVLRPTITETYQPDQVSVVVQVEIDENVVTTQESAGTTQENTGATQEEDPSAADKILALIKENPGIALGEIAEELGISRDGVKYHIEKLKKSVGLVHEGATKKGRWIVVNT